MITFPNWAQTVKVFQQKILSDHVILLILDEQQQTKIEIKRQFNHPLPHPHHHQHLWTLEPEIVETTFVNSCFSFRQRETRPFLFVPKRNNKKQGSFLVMSAQKRSETPRNTQKWPEMANWICHLKRWLPTMRGPHYGKELRINLHDN